MANYKIGDLVELKSGSPPMTVERVLGGKSYECAWFSGAKHNDAFFHEDALKLHEKPKSA